MTPARRLSFLVAIAVIATGTNAVKPVHIDDPVYLRIAEQILEDPLRPYDFVNIWFDGPQPAFEILSPPVVPYWLALCRAVSDDPTVWGWLQFPWILMLVLALDRLAQRFLGGFQPWWLVAVIFSPAILPGINLMLDIPALALGTASLATILSAVDSRSSARAIAAGLLLALAMEAKYTGVTFAVAWLVLTPKPLSSVRMLATGWSVAALVVVGVETGIALSEGRSHLWFHIVAILGHPIPRSVDRLLGVGNHFAVALPAATLFAWTALLRGRFPQRLRWLAAGGVAALAWWLTRAGLTYSADTHAASAAGGVDATATLMIAGALVGLVVPFTAGLRGSGAKGRLALWLLVELAFAVFASPFPAMRRVIGPTVVGWLLLWPGDREQPDAVWRRATIAASILVAFFYWQIDLSNAATQRDAANAFAQRFAPANGELWFVGHWGWRFHAEGAGMRVVMPGLSTLKAGDRLIVPDGIPRQRIATNRFRLLERVVYPPPVGGLPPPPRWGIGEYYFGSLPFSIATDHPFRATIYEARFDTAVPARPEDR